MFSSFIFKSLKSQLNQQENGFRRASLIHIFNSISKLNSECIMDFSPNSLTSLNFSSLSHSINRYIIDLKKCNAFLSAYPLLNLSFYSKLTKDSTYDTNAVMEEWNKEMESVFGNIEESKSNKNSPFENSVLNETNKTCDQYSLNDESSFPMSSPATSVFSQSLHSSPPPSPSPSPSSFSHVDSSGKATMVDVSQKSTSCRVAVATGQVILNENAFKLVKCNEIAKGDVLTVAKISGISGAKLTSVLMPLCHNIPLASVKVNLDLDETSHTVKIIAETTAVGSTGVEMEALTAVSVAALTVYDMCKAVQKDITISQIRLESKIGGKSGTWSRSK